MSQLIQMNRRINAVETIKKITHATRLIAMSSHTRLVNKEPIITNYKDEVKKLFAQLITNETDWQTKILRLSPTAPGSLIILIGSQKGFCGTFNVVLFKLLEAAMYKKNESNGFIAIGKKATQHLNKNKIKPIEAFTNLSTETLPNITELLTTSILSQLPNYKEVILFSNQPKTFFVQKPEKTVILPMAPLSSKKAKSEAYIWPESEEKILRILSHLYLQISIESSLFSSLVAEQAARFHSMDNATRNAEELLEAMQRDYNKMRQAKITTELIELASSFER